MENKNFTLTELADIMQLFTGDIKVLHFYASGSNFFSNHSELNDIYNMANDAYDKIAEMALAQKETVGNPITALSRVDGWEPLEIKLYPNDILVLTAIEKGQTMLDCLKAIADGYDTFIYSEIDSITAELDKEINYKFTQLTK